MALRERGRDVSWRKCQSRLVTNLRIDEEESAISREIRVMPNRIQCAHCQLTLTSFQELHEAERGNIYTVEVTEAPIEFFGIDPEEYVDVDEIVRRYGEDVAASYENE